MPTKKATSKAVYRLSKLADELQDAYSKAGDLLTQNLKPISDAIRKIGAPLEFEHLGESQRAIHEIGGDYTKAGNHPFHFALESKEDRGEREYALCAARGRDRTCDLYVSVCESNVMSREYINDDGRKEVERVPVVNDVKLLKPSELPLPLRVKILDVLEEFAEKYESEVRKSRKSLLE